MDNFGRILPVTRHETVLRLFRLADTDTFQSYRNDAEVARFQGWTPLTTPASRAFVAEMSTLKSFRHGDWIQLAIAATNDDALVGDLGVWISSDGTECEIGFTVDPRHQRRGHASRTVELIRDLLFQHTSVRLIRGICDERNIPSQRTLEKTGFRLSARNDVIFRGESCVELTYELSLPASLR